MNLLERLHTDGATSLWLDSVRRSYLRSGRFCHLAKRGIRGAIGYPSLFEHAVWGSAEYDAQLTALSRRHVGVEEIYWEMIITDVTAALACLQTVYEVSEGRDGFVVIDLPPTLAHDATGINATARSLHQQICRPNLLVRVLATESGISAATHLTADGIGVVVDVVDPNRYEQVIDAYLVGLETCPGDLSGLHGVAAFDLGRIEEMVVGELPAQQGSADTNAAMAVARRAYRLFGTRFSGPRWERLAHRGAKPQRPLWFPPRPRPGRSAIAVVQQLAGRDCVVAVSDDVATELERWVAPPAPRWCIDRPDGTTAMAVPDAKFEDATRVEEERVLRSARGAYDAVLAALAARATALR